MRLTDLEATFVRHIGGGSLQVEGVSLADAHGVMFLDPNGNGSSVMCFFRDPAADGSRIPDDVLPSIARWSRTGTGLHDLTLSPSVFVSPPRGWHGWIRNGEVIRA